MKKLIGALTVLAFVFVVNTAHAKDMNGKFGIGFHQTLGGVTGLGLKYWIGDFGLLFDVGLGIYKPSGVDMNMLVELGIGGIYNIARSESANLGFGLLVDLGIQKLGSADTQFHVEIELPLVAEYFFSDHFSIYGQVGLVVNIVGDKGAVLAPVTGKGGGVATKGFGIGLGNGLEATGGFSFYF